MILDIRNKAVKSLYHRGDTSKLPAEHIEKITRILTRLDAVKKPQEMNYPGSDFHPLKGNLQGFYSVKVQANWKVIFRFNGEDVTDVDYLDYH
jgi:proteic killer suppression protein